jgi:hypothetical protein
MLHEIEAIAVESDPQRQQELFKSASGKFAKMGILTPEQAAMPFDRKMLQTIYTKIKGGDEWQKLEGTRLTNEENRKKAADEAEKREFEIAGYWAGNVKDQGSYDQWLKIAPKRLAETLPKEFTPEGWQKTQNVLLTQQQRMQEVRAQATQTRLEQPTQLGDWVRIKHDPNSTTAEVARANAAIADFQAQARAGAINITPNQRISNESGLRDDYRQDTKNYVSVRDAYTKIQRAAQSGTAAGDISLIYGYMRMQDPTSTVREGEFATAQNAGSIPDRIRVLYNKAINGERLAPNIRADFLNQASNIYQQAEADYDQLVETYTEIARSGGMNPRSVVINLKPAKVPQPGDAKAGEIIERNGVKFRFKGGDKNRQENWEKIG